MAEAFDIIQKGRGQKVRERVEWVEKGGGGGRTRREGEQGGREAEARDILSPGGRSTSGGAVHDRWSGSQVTRNDPHHFRKPPVTPPTSLFLWVGVNPPSHPPSSTWERPIILWVYTNPTLMSAVGEWHPPCPVHGVQRPPMLWVLDPPPTFLVDAEEPLPLSMSYVHPPLPSPCPTCTLPSPCLQCTTSPPPRVVHVWYLLPF